MLRPFIFLFFLGVFTPVHGQNSDSLLTVIQDPSSKKAEAYYEYALQGTSLSPDSFISCMNSALRYARIENNPGIQLKATYSLASEYLRIQNADSADKWIDLVLKMLPNTDAPEADKAFIYYEVGRSFFDQLGFLIGLEYLDSAMFYAKKAEDTLRIGDIYNGYGIIYDNMGSRKKALEAYLEALKIFNGRDPGGYNNVLNNIATVYKQLGDYESAMKQYNLGLEYAEKTKNTRTIGINKINRGLLFKAMGEYDLALKDLWEALEIMEEMRYTYAISAIYHNLGETFYSAGRIDSAIAYLNKSQELSIDFDFFQNQVKNFLALGKCYILLENYSEVIKTAEAGYEMAIVIDQLEDLPEISKMLSMAYSKVGDHKKALEYHEKFKVFSDSVFDSRSREELNQLRVEHDLDRREREIENLTRESEYQKELVEARELLNLLLVISLIVVLAFVGVLLVLYQRRQKISKEIDNQRIELDELNKRKDSIITTIAHDLRGPINQIKGILNLLKPSMKDEESNNLVDVALRSSDIMTQRINKILDIEAINQGTINAQGEELDPEHILEEASSLLQPLKDKKGIEIQIQSEKGLVLRADRNYLLQVLENLGQNALKFSDGGTRVLLKAFLENGNGIISVHDQGPGIPKEEIPLLFKPHPKISTQATGGERSDGLGLTIVKRYVEAMGGEVWCESEIGVGSTFFVKMPLYKSSDS